MSLELLNQLENKVQTTLESLEMLRLEMDELKQENAALKEEKQAWENKLGQLLDKFSELENLADDSTTSPEQPATSTANW
ncbi:cell division protein ZapB [Marinospirillum alkaliphilum]|uniref:Cell division protein ZapB n=1 Tax=Marinospirillum alkaliphilum DSM 21637 TaxID=1122209 RepID=A0A1K1Z712_9GAMM|nr:cell division protein ZapB [Marinospirillum alkaliphilum]SFX69977.1 cell division protein ZapB [Marinospirillum alkaliphilum DSM 21637]